MQARIEELESELAEVEELLDQQRQASKQQLHKHSLTLQEFREQVQKKDLLIGLLQDRIKAQQAWIETNIGPPLSLKQDAACQATCELDVEEDNIDDVRKVKHAQKMAAKLASENDLLTQKNRELYQQLSQYTQQLAEKSSKLDASEISRRTLNEALSQQTIESVRYRNENQDFRSYFERTELRSEQTEKVEEIKTPEGGFSWAGIFSVIDKKETAVTPRNNAQYDRCGIGISLGVHEGRYFVSKLQPGGAAERSKILRMGDFIESVNGCKTTARNQEDVKMLLLGPKDSWVELVVWRENEEILVSLQRGIFDSYSSTNMAGSRPGAAGQPQREYVAIRSPGLFSTKSPSQPTSAASDFSASAAAAAFSPEEDDGAAGMPHVMPPLRTSHTPKVLW